MSEQWESKTFIDAIGADALFCDGDWIESKDQDPNGEVRLVQLADILDGEFKQKSERFMTRAKSNELRTTLLEKGDLLIARMPDPIGRACIFPGSEQDCVTVVDVAIARPTNCDPEWLMHCLNSQSLRTAIEERATGSTRKRISRSALSEMTLPVPPLPEQKKIAEILSGIDKLIGHQEKKIITLGNLQASLIEDAALGKQEPGEKKPTDIGECPADWQLTHLGDIADFSNGNSFKSDDWKEDGYPIIRIQNLNGGSDFNYFAGEVDEKWFVPHGSLLFAWSGQRGKSFGPFIWQGPDGVLNQHIFKISHSVKIYKLFLFLLLKMVQLKAEREAHGFKDSFMHVKKSDITSTILAVPPIETQKRLAVAYEKVALQKRLEDEKLNAFKVLKTSLSSDLLSGRKRVSI